MWDDLRQSPGTGFNRKVLLVGIIIAVCIIAITALALNQASPTKQSSAVGDAGSTTSVLAPGGSPPATSTPLQDEHGDDAPPVGLDPNAPLVKPGPEPGVDPAVSARAKDIARAYVVALQTRKGRENFREYMSDEDLPCQKRSTFT